MPNVLPRPALLAALSLLTAGELAAQRPDSTPPHQPARTPRTPPGRPLVPDRVALIDSLKQPESVLYDSTADAYYISNLDGPFLAKDGRGFISRLNGTGELDSLRWISSGVNDVTLNAPKGMALSGDTLWVTDIDVVRGFDRRSGRPVASIDLAPLGPVFLNDLVSGLDGSLYVTDTRVRPDTLGLLVSAGPARIYRIGPDRQPEIAFESDRLARANGIAWEPSGQRFIVVPFGGDTLFTWKPQSDGLSVLATGPGLFDGVAIGPDGEVLVTSKATGSLHQVSGRRLGRLIEHMGDVADFDVNRRARVVAIALTAENRVSLYRLGK